MKQTKLYIIDYYIIRKFLGTFSYAIMLIIVIAVIFDFSEKVDDFLEHNAPAKAIIVDYYLNFIPYFVILYSHLFTFIAVIFFTSRMAYNSEIIAILSSGISYRRFLFPYFISAFIIAIFAFFFTNYVVPSATKARLEFEEKYFHNRPVDYSYRNIHRQIKPGIYIYMESYSNLSNQGYKFSIEKFKNDKLVSKLMAEYVEWDSIKHKWTARDYYIRNIDTTLHEKIVQGKAIDTSLDIYPADFRRRNNAVEAMNTFELNKFIKEQKLQGAENVETYLIEKYKRTAQPFSTFILTLIAVSLSSRKVRGGIGLHVGIGLGFCFSYIVFMQFTSQFAISGGLNSFIAVWLPNIVYALIGLYLYKLAPK